MYSHSFESFLKDRYAALRKHKSIFFMAIIAMMIFSIYFVLAFTANLDAPTAGANISGSEYFLTCNITLTESDVENITRVGFYFANSSSSDDNLAVLTTFFLIGENTSMQGGGNESGTPANVTYTKIWDTTGYPDGPYNVTCLADNSTAAIAGENRSSNITGVHINNNAPVFSDIFPEGSNFTADTTPEIYINVTDIGTGVERSSINMSIAKNGGVDIRNVSATVRAIGPENGSTTGRGFIVNYTWGVGGVLDPSLVGGDYLAVAVYAKDKEDNRLAVASWNITIDTAMPNITIITPASDLNLTGSEDNITVQVSDDQTTTSLNVSDVYAALKNSTGYYKLNGSSAFESDYGNWTRLDQSGSSDKFNATLISDNFADGIFTLYVNASDYAGNVKESSTRIIEIDNTAPSGLALNQPSNYTNSTDTTPTLKWEPAIEKNFINYTVQIDDTLDFSSIVYTETTTSLILNTSNSTTVVTELNADTLFYWRVTAWDAAGNSQTAGSFVYVTDTSAPEIIMRKPNTTATVNLTRDWDEVNISVDQNISGAYAALLKGSVYHKLDGSQINITGTEYVNWTQMVVINGTDYGATINSTNFSDGIYTLYINVSDESGNVNSTSLIIVEIDNTAPTAFDIVEPLDAIVSTGLTPTFNWTSSADKNFHNYTVQIDDTDISFGSIVFTYNTTSNATNTTTATSALTADTTYYWLVVAWDAAGNSRTSTSNFSYITDNVAPSINVTNPATNATNQTSSAVNVSIKVSDKNMNISDVWAALKNASGYYALNDGTTNRTGDYRNWTNLAHVVSTDTYNVTNGTLNANNFADGNYVLYVNASDKAENMSTNYSITLTIDNNMPTYSNPIPGEGNITNDATPSVSITLTDAGTYVLNDSISIWAYYSSSWNDISSLVGLDKFEIGSNAIQVNFTLPTQADGTNVIVNVSANDYVGNGVNMTWNFTIDTANPAILIEAPATNQTNQTASNVNISATYTDTHRNVSDIWAGLKNDTGYYKLDGSMSATGDYRNWTNLDQSGSSDSFNATLNSDNFADGPYILYINASDNAGNVVENTSYSLHIDNLGPSYKDVYPINNSNTSVADIGFVFNVSDVVSTAFVCNITIVNDTGSNVSYINFVANNNSADDIASISNKTGNFTFINGTYTWYATCADELSNSNSTYINTLYVENSAFGITLDAPAAFSNQSGTNVSVQFTIANPTYPAVWCNVTIDDTQINNTVAITVANGSSQTWHNFTGMANGLHEWNVSCWDALFLVNSTTMYFTYDSAAPIVALKLPADELNTTDATPEFVFNVSDSLSSNFTCELFVSGVSNGTAVANNDTAQDSLINGSITPAYALAEGTYAWYVNCTDHGGNIGQSSTTRSITIDTTAPALQIQAPGNNTNQTSELMLNVTVNITETNWNVSDVWAALLRGEVYHQLDGSQINSSGTTYRMWTNLVEQAASLTYFNATMNATNLTDGTYILLVNSSDIAGTIGAAPGMTLVIDKTAPVIQNISYNNASVGATIGISANVSDATSGLAGGTANAGNCTIYFNTTFMASVLYDSTKGGCNTTFTVPGTFTVGNYTLGINVSDWAGNNGSNVSYTIQVFTDNDAPKVNLTAPANYTNQSSTSLTVTWTAADNLDTILDCNVSLVNTTDIKNITVTAESGLQNSTIISNVPQSKYNISVTCWDDTLNENLSISNADIIIDNTAPVIDINATTLVDQYNLSATTITVTFNVTDSFSANFSCELFFNGDTSKGTNSTNVTNSTAAETHTINSSNTANGNYVAYVNCTDFVGNRGQSESKVITFDTTGPAVTINYPTEGNHYKQGNISVNVTVIDANTNVTSSTLQFRLVNISAVGNTTSWENFSFSTIGAESAVNISEILEGNYTLEIRVNDTLNNQNASVNLTIVVDRTVPNLVNWTYSSVSKNVVLTFDETMDASSLDLTKINITYPDGVIGNEILEKLTTSIPSTTNRTTSTITLRAAKYNALDAVASSNMSLYLGAGVINDLSANSIAASSNTTVAAYTTYTIRRPDARGTYWAEDTWVSFTLSFTALQAATSLANYNVTNVLNSISGSYAAFYAYNKTSGSWLAYVPGTGGTFSAFASDMDSTAYELNMTAQDALEIA